jgi:hypothetical protein
MNNKKYAVIYLIGLSGVALALAFMISPNNISVIAQQNSTNTGGNSTNKTISITMTPNGQQQQNRYSMSTSPGSQNWTGSISLFSPIIDAFKSKIHVTLNDATTNATNAVGGANSSAAVAAFIHPERGFLVYDVFVLDPSNNVHRVIVDPGNGKVLSNQPMSLMDMMSIMHHSIGMGGMMMMIGPHEMMMDHGMGMMQHGMMGGPDMGMMSNPPHGMGMMGPSQDGAWP